MPAVIKITMGIPSPRGKRRASVASWVVIVYANSSAFPTPPPAPPAKVILSLPPVRGCVRPSLCAQGCDASHPSALQPFRHAGTGLNQTPLQTAIPI